MLLYSNTNIVLILMYLMMTIIIVIVNTIILTITNCTDYYEASRTPASPSATSTPSPSGGAWRGPCAGL